MATQMVDRGSVRARLRSTRIPAAAVVAAAVLSLALALAGDAAGRSFVPRHNRIFHGVSDTTNNEDFRRFKKRVGAHPAVLEDFYHWDTPLTSGALQRWRETRTRGVLSLSTAPGGQPEIISTRQIAKGRGDHYILRLNQTIAESEQVVYLRLFPEMNGSWNPYCAFNANGTRKDRSHSTSSFRRAWRRIVLIIRGGPRRTINRKLRQRHMPRILRASSNHAPIYEREHVDGRLPRPKVAFMWSPQTIGSPQVSGNRAGRYWPGKRFVDWVGADIYSAYASPGVWAAFKRFYRKWRRWPFVVGEYSPWDNDYRGRFTRKLFKFALRHGRTRMLIYYRSVNPETPFDIDNFPRAKRVLRRMLNRRRFAPYAPDLRPHGSHRHHPNRRHRPRHHRR
ncbi:MAG: hypothetical protein AABM66_08645 [Actinomycetota bacterium]